ncbi:MAG: citrate synthase/methylcitrate synthase [Anaerolineales bacterium]|nr:citrate synthase/methylcitrate synthase [Anaerolineales bacterium]
MTDIARGLAGVVLTETRLSRVDGEKGELTIAGFPLQELAPNASFEETLYLLWHDSLPTETELANLKSSLAQARTLPESAHELLREAAAAELPPMDALRLAAGTLSLKDPEPEATDREANLRRARRLVAAFPTLIAAYWRLLQQQEPVEPREDLGHAANFLYMIHGAAPDEAAARGLETYLNTVIDHGMNASTFTARVIVSTRSDMISAIVGAVGALKGPLHGGAPGPALDTVFDLREQAQESGRPMEQVAEEWARRTVEAGERIMGFGHRVYKVRDPRADVLGAAAERLFERTGDSQLYEDARAAERAFLDVLEELKPGRGLDTNVEFYTALVLHGIGLEPAIFSSIFAMSRVGGWTAHVLEQIEDDILIRPRAKYVGDRDRQWVPLSERD